MNYDDLDFETRDLIDAEHDAAAESLREAITGLPARPGVRR